ncbi:signal peptidase I [Jatrophihabitans sp.]|uniref:signal peptidase I n=1 Tax=Jatrophihabitans sp. TaxID=1932789 RepID=UPI002C384370|nr:signal peptidase I [Jatrophihabitans sp.]
MRMLRRATRLLSTLLLGLAVLCLLAVTVGPRLLDYRTATMLTASMAPGIRPGDVIVDTPLALSDVRVGQVLTYHIPVGDHQVVSHRVIEVQRPAPGVVNIRTQGDANPAPDPWTATLTGGTVWQVRAVVPKAGVVIRALRTPWVHTALTGAVPILVLVWLLMGIWWPAKPAESAESAETTAPAESVEPAPADIEPAGTGR